MNGQITRREFLSRGTAAAGLLAAGLSAADPGYGDDSGGRPNILFILTDDQRYDAMGFMGRPSFLKTPNMDRLAREGAHIRNAFVTTSLCSPSRACFLTGTYAHRHGVVTNEGNDPDPSCPTFPLLLQKAGYETAYVGKWHMAPKADPRPGFDYWLSFVGQGVYENPKLNENGRSFQAEGYMTDLLTDYAVKWLGRKREKPFCMVLAHKAVHGPFTPAARHRDAFPDAEIPEPASFRDTYEDKPEWMRRAFTYGLRRNQVVASMDMPTPKKIERKGWNGKGMLDYYRTILGIDDSIGKVLDTLESTGQLDNTVIVFAGDNGYFVGEHGLGDKRLMFEESIRIPLLVRYPKLVKPGSRVEETVLNIDLAPTLLDLAGAKIPAGMLGCSMAPLLRGRKTRPRESFLYEYFREAWAAGLPLMLGVRTNRWKYCSYPDMKDIDELYDLQTDPLEMHNLSQDPAHAGKVKEMRAELSRLKKETGYPEGVQLGAPPVGLEEKAKRIEGCVLSFDFSKGDAADLSGRQNNGVLHGGRFVEDAGRKVLRLGDGDYVDVPPSSALDAGMIPWTIEARVNAESADGIVMAQGGESNGYSLYLKKGVPCFALRAEGLLTEIAGKETLGGWTRLTAAIAKDAMKLYLDGKLVASKSGIGLLPANPVEGLQIGIETGTHVGSYTKAVPFTGLVEYVRIWAGKHKVE
ncbi:MAG: sulfatase-like hydrolase/transferase [Armatimonadetes bacterium]|nr:sulfatase-like hydrolase/transferase [Armatimonadota bacterium]